MTPEQQLVEVVEERVVGTMQALVGGQVAKTVGKALALGIVGAIRDAGFDVFKEKQVVFVASGQAAPAPASASSQGLLVLVKPQRDSVSGKATLVADKTGKTVWIPKSQITEAGEVGEYELWRVPKWLVDEKGLIVEAGT